MPAVNIKFDSLFFRGGRDGLIAKGLCVRFPGILLTIVLLIVAGCRDSSSGEDPNEIIIHAVSPAKIRGFDPADIGDRPTAIVAGQIFECLYQYHYLKRPYQIIPLIADGMPRISEDGLSYTVKIKKRVYFQDDECFPGGKGRQVKASDFVYSWKRIADIKNLSRNWWIFDGHIVGLDEFRQYTKTCKKRKDVDYSREVEGLKAIDGYTLVIKLTKPWPQIIYMLAHQPTSVVAKEAVDYYGRDIISHPVGTGPFKLVVWNRGSYIEMIRNPTYRDEFYPSEGEQEDEQGGLLADAGKKLPMADRIRWVMIEEAQPRWLQFLRGKLDASGIPKDNFGQALNASLELTAQMKQRGLSLKTFREPSTFWIGFNMEDPVIGASKALRKAMAYSVDRKRYIDVFWNGRDEAAYGFIPPLMKSYNPQIKEFGQRFDRAKAAEFLEQAREDFGGKLPLVRLSMPSTGTLARQIGQFYQRQFRDIGLEVETEYLDWPTFLEKVKTKSAQMFSMGWIADYPDVESFLQLFYSRNVSPGSNSFNYSSKEFDRLYEKVAVMRDSPERTKLYQQAEKMIIEDCPAIFINHPVNYVLYHNWVGNYKPHVFQYGLAKYHRVDMKKRAAYPELLKKVK